MLSRVLLLWTILQTGLAIPFTEWIQGVNLTLPEFPITTPGILAIFVNNIDIAGGVCKDFTIGALNVSEVNGSAAGLDAVFGLQGLGFHCELVLSLSSHVPFYGGTSGPMSLQLTVEPSSIFIGLEVPGTQGEPVSLPEGANLTMCNAALKLDVLLTPLSTKHKELRVANKVASLINSVAAGLTPEAINGLICPLITNVVDGSLNETLINLTDWLVADNVLVEVDDELDPILSSSATNINELFETGDLGNAIQSILHDSRYDVSNTTQLGELLQGIIKNLKTSPEKIFSALEDAIRPSTPFQELSLSPFPIKFSLELLNATIGGSLAPDGCKGDGGWPSTILKGTTTEHKQRIQTGEISAECSADLNLTVSLPSAITLFGLDIELEAPVLDISAGLGAAVEGVSVYLSILLGLDGNRMMQDFYEDQWTRPGCLVQMLDGGDSQNLQLLGLKADLSALDLNLASLDHDETMESILIGLSQGAQGLLDAYLPIVIHLIKGKAARNLVNNGIQNWLTKSTDCPATTYLSPMNETVIVTSGVWTALFGVVAIVAVFWFGVQRGRKPEGRQQSLLAEDAISLSATVSPPMIWAVNFVLVAIMGLTVLSVTTNNLKLQITVTDPDPAGGGAQEQTGEKMLDFTMWFLARNLGRYNAWPLMVIVILGAIILPLGRNLILLACWNLPTTTLSIKTRGQMMTAVNSMGRGNMLETFLIALLTKSMHIPLIDPAGSHTPFLMEVCPQIGFYLFLVAIVAGMAVSESMLSLHTVAAAADETGESAAAVTSGDGERVEGESEVLLVKVPLCQAVKSSMTVRALTWFSVLVTPLLLCVGMLMDSYSLGQPGSIQGALKWLLGSPVWGDFSVITATFQFPWPTQTTGALPLQIGWFFLVAAVIWFAIVAPLLLSAVSVVLWMVPLSLSAQKRAMGWAEFMYNWQALDVYLVTVIALCVLGGVLSHVFEQVLENESSMSGTCVLLSNIGSSCVTVYTDLLWPGMGFLIASVVSLTASTLLVGHQAKGVLGN